MNTIVTILFVLVAGAGSPACEDGRAIANQAATYLSASGLRVRAEIVCTNDTLAHMASVDYFPFSRFSAWHRWMREVGFLKRGRPTHLLLSPYKPGELMAGRAYGICSVAGLQNTSYSTASPDLKLSAILAAHELYHSFGATHIDAVPNIMNQSWRWGDGGAVAIDRATKIEVRACMNRIF